MKRLTDLQLANAMVLATPLVLMGLALILRLPEETWRLASATGRLGVIGLCIIGGWQCGTSGYGIPALVAVALSVTTSMRWCGEVFSDGQSANVSMLIAFTSILIYASTFVGTLWLIRRFPSLKGTLN